MVRELVMAAICAVGVIALAWAMDHPRKELGSALALGAFVVLTVVAFLKNQNRVSRAPHRILHRERGAPGGCKEQKGESGASERKCGGDSPPASAG